MRSARSPTPTTRATVLKSTPRILHSIVPSEDDPVSPPRIGPEAETVRRKDARAATKEGIHASFQLDLARHDLDRCGLGGGLRRLLDRLHARERERGFRN